jgi:hypothetical protein
MKVAFTIDDLPMWPHGHYPDGYTPDSIAEALILALKKHSIRGVFAFSNSLPLVEDPTLTRIFDRWVEAGHYVGNHTHSHPLIYNVSAEEYINEIEQASQYLAPWISRAPDRYFRYTLNLWGETEEKLKAVKAHLDASGYKIAEVTTWLYEWDWNTAYERCLLTGDSGGIDFLKKSFPEFVIAQLEFDMEVSEQWYGGDTKGIVLGHTLPFLVDVADAMFERLIKEGVEFIPLGEVASDPFYNQAASIVSDQFLVYARKLAHNQGKIIPMIAPGFESTYKRVMEMC